MSEAHIQQSTLASRSKDRDELANSEVWTYESPWLRTITDNRDSLETPEGAIINVRPAGIASRGAALLIDEGVKLATIVLLSLFLSLLGVAIESIATLLMFLAYFAMSWFYGVVFEVFNDGRTPGKSAMSLRAVHSDATPIQLPASLIRNLLRFVDTFFFFIPGIVSMAFSKNFKRLGDMAADTIVIYDHDSKAAKQSDQISATTLPFRLTRQEQVLLVDYQDRINELSGPRTIELAEILQPLHGAKGKQAVQATLGYASGIRS